MVSLELLDEADIENIIRWNNDKTADFLYQWAGSGYDYPVTAGMIKKRFSEGVNGKGSDTYIFKIISGPSGEMIGTVELTCIDMSKRFGVVARFLIGEDGCRGKGLGEQALNQLVGMAFDKFLLESLALKVFDFNIAAIRCYEKVGFRVSKYIKNARKSESGAWGAYEMTLTLGSWEKYGNSHNLNKSGNGNESKGLQLFK